MNMRTLVWALAAVAFLGSLAIGDANAFFRRAYVAQGSGGYSYSLEPSFGYGYGQGYGYGYGYNPYVAPMPAFGILPPPLATMAMLDKDGLGYNRPVRETRGARTQGSLYPTEKSPVERQADRRRVRFEITVPYAEAVVKFDGAATKQTGLKRVFVTPPMAEDKQYTVTIEAQWPRPDSKISAVWRKTFTVVAGETVQYTFAE